MKNHLIKPLTLALLAAGSSWAVADNAADAHAIMNSSCIACHTAEGNNEFSRISHQRKTPEGWLMTIARMQQMHGLKISDADRRTLVKYLADSQGLAPSEAADYRYILERRLNTREEFEDQTFTETCARCHSGARVMLQHREAGEWEHLAHFHLGQYPSAEYQSLARDRDWFPIVLNQMVPMLSQQQPMQTSAWSQWQGSNAGPVAGSWTVAGHMPGKGDLVATMTATATEGADQYAITLDGQYADGTPVSGSGTAIIYTGYEWRGTLTIDGLKMRQVFAIHNGKITGRMFNVDDDSMGIDIVASHADNTSSEILAVQPGYLKAGTEAELTIVGSKLAGMPNLGKGITIVSLQREGDSVIRLRARADQNVEGIQAVTVGKAKGGELAVYSKIDSIKVVPDYAVARIGGNGGSTPNLSAHFEAQAMSAGKDGKPGTADDFVIGMVPANWSVAPFDEVAKEDNDVGFSGYLNPQTGVFTTAGAGPNPERRMMTNNAGHLIVTGTAEGQSADAELIVTVQRWNNPPIP
ncbi:quinohemoprotein amine dehydrogenase subunit alpha [Oceanobacter mangrovi]|uniref:quinohemoprotein amine dehydrogenase subunit alpha n=1 Tax=Oceanobacter mangrovi TaxID=2862510 RepID=UPI001FE86DF6|nr:quinohemoprotein amine dehydrogenase subunit alpha [Oceanobacter mangrovi]